MARDERRLVAAYEQLCRLEPDTRRIVELYLGHDQSFADIGAEVGFTVFAAWTPSAIILRQSRDRDLEVPRVVQLPTRARTVGEGLRLRILHFIEMATRAPRSA
jgi:hypothetical protein